MTDLGRIEKLIESAQIEIELGKCLERLKDNKDFNDVFLKNYLVDYAAGLVRAKSQPGIFGTPAEKCVDAQISGVGHFSQFMEITLTQAVNAKGSLEHSERERDLIIDEE